MNSATATASIAEMTGTPTTNSGKIIAIPAAVFSCCVMHNITIVQPARAIAGRKLMAARMAYPAAQFPSTEQG
jgi:hypothetical protein